MRQEIQMKRRPPLIQYVLCGCILYLGAYVVLLTTGWFDLATLPWNDQQDKALYKLFLPMEWLRHTLRP
jgi:hypothetical protein